MRQASSHCVQRMNKRIRYPPSRYLFVSLCTLFLSTTSLFLLQLDWIEFYMGSYHFLSISIQKYPQHTHTHTTSTFFSAASAMDRCSVELKLWHFHKEMDVLGSSRWGHWSDIYKRVNGCCWAREKRKLAWKKHKHSRYYHIFTDAPWRSFCPSCCGTKMVHEKKSLLATAVPTSKVSSKMSEHFNKHSREVNE